MNPLFITADSLVNPLGRGTAATWAALRDGRSGLRRCDFEDVDLETWIGRVEGLEDEALPSALAEYDCRNNRLALLGLVTDGFDQAVVRARQRHGAHRIAVVIGTSTAGVLSTEMAYRRRDASGRLPPDYHYRTTHDNFSVTDLVRRHLRLEGPAFTLSAACSSSAKVFASASRLLENDLCDAVVVGGVDSLCFTTLYGFASLEVISSTPCRPADVDRNGISIGEAAGFALLERQSTGGHARLLGYGESSDAHHMSSPHPEGLGARLAMERALTRAGLTPSQIDYINLHGTATRANDAAEDLAVSGLFGNAVPCSSTKGWTGHTLGAAGITEALIACLCLREGFAPASLNTVTVDPSFKAHILRANHHQPVRHVLSNSFGFGGNNACLVMGSG